MASKTFYLKSTTAAVLRAISAHAAEIDAQVTRLGGNDTSIGSIKRHMDEIVSLNNLLSYRDQVFVTTKDNTD